MATRILRTVQSASIKALASSDESILLVVSHLSILTNCIFFSRDNALQLLFHFPIGFLVLGIEVGVVGEHVCACSG